MLVSGSVALAKIQGPKRKGSSSFQPSFFRGELLFFFADVVIHLEPGCDINDYLFYLFDMFGVSSSFCSIFCSYYCMLFHVCCFAGKCFCQAVYYYQLLLLLPLS